MACSGNGKVAAAGAFLALCLLTGTGVCSDQVLVHEVNNQTCSDGKLSVTLKNTVTLQCADPIPVLDPADPNNVYRDESPLEPPTTLTTLNQVAQGVTAVATEDRKGCTLNITGNPKDGTKFIYICKKNQEAGPRMVKASLDEEAKSAPKALEKCVVTVTVKHEKNPDKDEGGLKPPLPDQEAGTPQEDQVHTCSAGQDTSLTVSAPNQQLKLKCESGLHFEPRAVLNAFDDENGNCDMQKTLGSLVPGAVRKGEEDALTLQISRLPETGGSRKLCYLCQPSADEIAQKGSDKACRFRITVKPSEESSARGWSGLGAHLFSVAGAVLAAATALFSA
ncbi:hypothetical protein BESB_038340 [Besnoitia besnoiti]|uniref:SRS domain-containing protein n=1 Tax=Besnoitia besnoiti TaxID=94643 RepID=A0A2A9MMN1_BESBE|nr:hypothetical protein BESB_038340 [Besnoitia besnoiti]PFH37376.1 hypothetical protein BESB_038340 [Besnoitia besnoiti]